MASGPPSPHGHAPAHEDVEKNSLSDTSGEQETNRVQNLDPVTGKPVQDLPGDKVELTEEDCMDELGFSFPEWKKWFVTSFPNHFSLRSVSTCGAGECLLVIASHQIRKERLIGYE